MEFKLPNSAVPWRREGIRTEKWKITHGWLEGERARWGSKSTGLGDRGAAFIQQIEKSRGNRCEDPEVGTSLSFSGNRLKVRG